MAHTFFKSYGNFVVLGGIGGFFYFFFCEYCEKVRLCHLSPIQQDWQEELGVVPRGLCHQQSWHLICGILSAKSRAMKSGDDCNCFVSSLLQLKVVIIVVWRWYPLFPWMPESLEYEGFPRIHLDGIYFQANSSGVEAHVFFWFKAILQTCCNYLYKTSI